MNRHFAPFLARTILFLPLLCFTAGATNWSLPYPRPSKYDYSQYYSDQLASGIESSPDFFKESMEGAWKWYKDNFTLSSGLIQHRKGEEHNDNSSVSEGEGYGMLLAVIMNDQPMFDKIFAAANRHMWDNGAKSYHCWEWENGGCKSSGAASDADLDIGLALVFADKLQEYGYWDPSSAGVSYKQRAMEVIGSIRQNMCREDYLLPGDTWGGDGLDSQNPSYYAVAWMKVFNQYQDQHDFTPVIDNCYDVLKKVPQYNKGQAPNWCSRNGSHASKGIGENQMDMGYDGVRTPWRIAMDALWFDDPRAIEFCQNSKNTLTAYDEGVNEVFIQMSLYNSAGQRYSDDIQSTTCGTAAIWLSAVLGSKDAEYSKPVFQISMLKNIAASNSYFGSEADAYYYYWQSLGMLGFATITGLFPNILEDLEEDVVPPDPITLVSPLSVSSASVDLPTSVTISAEFDSIARWELTLTGQTSGKTQTFSGSSARVSETWTGNGWYDSEEVEVSLNVSYLDENTPESDLIADITIVTPMDRPDIEPGSAMTIHDLEEGTIVNDWNGEWYVYCDDASTISPSPEEPEGLITEGGNPGKCIKTEFDYVSAEGWAGVGMAITVEGETIDLSNFEGVTFDYKTDGIDQIRVILGTTNITDDAFAGATINGTGGSWKTESVSFSGLTPPSWGSGANADLSVSEKVQWQVEPGATGTVYIDNVSFQLKAGELPGDDILAQLQTSPIKSKGAPKTSFRARPKIQYRKGSILIDGINATDVSIYTVSGRKHTRCSLRPSRKSIRAVPDTYLSAGVYIVKIGSKTAGQVTGRITVY